MKIASFSLLAALVATFPALTPSLAQAQVEAPIAMATGILVYEVEMSGERAGRPVHHRIRVTSPVSSRGSGPLNLLGYAFTTSQQREIDAMSAATAGDGEADILAAGAALEQMLAACATPDTVICKTAQARYQTAEATLSAHATATTSAQAAVVHDRSDDHRFLMLMPGEQGQDCGSVDVTFQDGAQQAQAHLPPAELVACQTMAVLDRRTGDLALRMSPATVKVGQVRVVDLSPLADTPGIELGALRISLTLPLQPTTFVDGRYSGSRTLQAQGMTYRFTWRLTLA